MSLIYNYVIPQGVIIPDTQDIQNDVITEYKDQFGANLVTTANTPQGILITAESLARSAMAQNNANLANQINPNLAGGIYLDALLALTGSSRTTATPSLVDVTLSGEAGTVIPAGSQASDVNGNIWETLSDETIGAGSPGTVVATMQAFLDGAIIVNANQINTIVTPVIGWDSVTNEAANYYTGTVEQSDADARALRLNTLAIQGQSLPQAITSGLFAIPGVIGVSFLENVTATSSSVPAKNSGNPATTLVANSIYVCVDPGISSTTTYSAGTITQSGTTITGTGTTFTSAMVGGTITPTGYSAMDITGFTSATSITVNVSQTISTATAYSLVYTSPYPNINSNDEIANTILEKKSAGCNWNNGNGHAQSVSITNAYSGQVFNVLFDLPILLPMQIQMTVSNPGGIINLINAIQTLIYNYSLTNWTVNQNISAYDLSGVILQTYPTIIIHSFQVAVGAPTPVWLSEYLTEIYQKPTINLPSIQVTVS